MNPFVYLWEFILYLRKLFSVSDDINEIPIDVFIDCIVLIKLRL